jgi:Domain of unknown function (DUF4136)
MNILRLSSYRIGIAILVSLIAGCATIVADSDQYGQANFSAYQTYGWIDGDPLMRPRGAEPSVSPLNVRRIQEAIESELSRKGYRKVEESLGADFVVSFTVGARDKIAVDSYPAPYRGPWEWGWYGHDVDVRSYMEGTLSIDVFDGAKRQPVWHGWATKEVYESDVSNPAPVIKRAVSAILRKFPSRKP